MIQHWRIGRRAAYTAAGHGPLRVRHRGAMSHCACGEPTGHPDAFSDHLTRAALTQAGVTDPAAIEVAVRLLAPPSPFNGSWEDVLTLATGVAD